MPRATALKIRVEDRPGMLGEVAGALGAAGVNLRAVHGWAEEGQGILRLIVHEPVAARAVLAARGWAAEDEEVLEVVLSDRPGTLGDAAKMLGDAGVNIRYVFVGTSRGPLATVFLAVSDMATALATLGEEASAAAGAGAASAG